jgi:PAS domain S-box-containing protein
MKWSGLIRKLLAGILVIEIMMLSILVYNSVRLLSSTHAELFKRTTSEEVTLLGSLLVSGLSVRDLAQINENLQQFSRQANVKYAVVYDRRQRVMGKVGTPPAKFTLDKSFEDALSDGVYDTEYTVQLDGEVFGTLRAGFSIKEIAQLSKKAKLQNTMIALTEILLTITVTMLIGVYLVRRITSLQTGARNLQEGNYAYQIPATDNDELGELANAFNQLGASLEKSNKEIQAKQHEIQQKAARFSRLLNSVNAIIFEATIRPFHISFVNKEAENLLGYPPHDWQKPGFLRDITHADDLFMLEQFINNPENKEHHSFDYRVRRKDGEFIWLRQIINIENNAEQRIIHGILIDVTKEKRNADVERARDIALAENRTKNLFLANMSHELRTPLNAIIGYTELIVEDCRGGDPLDKTSVAEDLDKVGRSAKHLLALISEVLDISRINAGKFELNLSEFDITDLVKEVSDVIGPLAEKNNNQFVVELRRSFKVYADQKRLYQVIVNLCANACKFTENGHINLTLSYEPGASTYLINIADTGIGIKSDELDKLFKEFARTEDVSRIEGTGLGLCLSQKLCNLMGGHITLASEYGKGSTFSVSMPVRVKPLERKKEDEELPYLFGCIANSSK